MNSEREKVLQKKKKKSRRSQYKYIFYYIVGVLVVDTMPIYQSKLRSKPQHRPRRYRNVKYLVCLVYHTYTRLDTNVKCAYRVTPSSLPP